MTCGSSHPIAQQWSQLARKVERAGDYYEVLFGCFKDGCLQGVWRPLETTCRFPGCLLRGLGEGLRWHGPGARRGGGEDLVGERRQGFQYRMNCLVRGNAKDKKEALVFDGSPKRLG